MGVFLVAFAVLNAVILGFHVALAVGLFANIRAERRHLGSVAPRELRPEVIVAVRDEEQSLPRLLASLVAQTRDDCLFLFIDDRSTDSTPKCSAVFLRR